ncbi:hypothetical protein [Streptomyces cavernae]|uniref:hypothetical protein n=1 Tax=Streptomyces cavernae TaxID=2259034 RepID=UPI000FEBB0E7|nr:hypothetical protein [Streptomyces cavernae]
MRSLRWGLAASGWVALAATALQAGHPLRVACMTVFLVLCPGLAAVSGLRLTALSTGGWAALRPDPYALLKTVVLTVVLSLALSMLVAEALFLGGAFTTERAVLVLAAVTSVLALLPRKAGRG